MDGSNGQIPSRIRATVQNLKICLFSRQLAFKMILDWSANSSCLSISIQQLVLSIVAND